MIIFFFWKGKKHFGKTRKCWLPQLSSFPYVFLKSPASGSFNPFPHNKILDLTELKAFADDKLNVIKILISVFDRVENIVRKEKLLVQAIFPIPTMFWKGFFPRGVKRFHCVGMGQSRDCVLNCWNSATN